MTAQSDQDRHARNRCPRQLLPGAADGAHPGDSGVVGRRRHSGRVLGSRLAHGHPEVDREGRPQVGRHMTPSTATTRSWSRSSTRKATMDSIVIIGGGVGGTIVANLVSRHLGDDIDDGPSGHGHRRVRPACLPARLHVHHVRQERPSNLSRPERTLLDDRVQLVVGDVDSIDERTQRSSRSPASASVYDHLVIASGSRIVPEEIPHFEQEAQHFYSRRRGPAAASSARCIQRRPDRGRHRGDALQVPACAARGGVSH